MAFAAAVKANFLLVGRWLLGKTNPTNSPVKHKNQPIMVGTSGEVLPEGSLLELIRERPGSDKVSLLHWESGRVTVAQQHVFGDRVYVATENAKYLKQLPAKPVPYESTEELFKALVDFLPGFVALPDGDSALLAYFCFASYFCDCVTMSPCLLLYGPSPVDGVSVLRGMACVCRHPLLLARSSVSRLPQELSPTRLICQPDGDLENLLAALLFPGFGIGLRHISGATVLFVGQEELTTPFADACLSMSLPPQSKLFSIQDEERQAVSIQKLRNQLLMYRLRNFSRVKGATFDAPELCGSSRELARTLGRCIVDAPALQDRLLSLLKPRHEAGRVEAATTPLAVIIEALLVLCHERKPTAYVGEVTVLANTILTRNEERVILKAKQVGAILKHLGLPPTRLDSQGRGIFFVDAGCSRIHRLARAYGVPAIRKGLLGCRYCKAS